MYCPKCSQQQSSEDMRFCSRCGFPLAGVSLLVVNDGVIPQATAKPASAGSSSRKRVLTESAIFTGITWAIAIGATNWFDFGGPFENVAKFAALLFLLLGLIGLCRFLYGFLFMKGVGDQPEYSALPNSVSQNALADVPRRTALSGQRDFSATDYTRPANTREMAQRPSVTENTTRLLEEQPTDRS